MPRSMPAWGRLRPSRPLVAVLLVVLLAMLSVLQLANAARLSPSSAPLQALGLPGPGLPAACSVAMPGPMRRSCAW